MMGHGPLVSAGWCGVDTGKMAAILTDSVVYSLWPVLQAVASTSEGFLKLISCLWGNVSIALSLSSLAEKFMDTLVWKPGVSGVRV